MGARACTGQRENSSEFLARRYKGVCNATASRRGRKDLRTRPLPAHVLAVLRPASRSSGMKPVSLAFNDEQRASKSSKRDVHERSEADERRHITQFSAGEAPAEVQPKKARKVIPVQPNKLQPKAAGKDDKEALGKLEDRFEGATLQEEKSDVYGLIERREKARAGGSELPADKFHEQAAALAEEPSADAYAEMPVEDFGMALLRGMGMKEEHKVETVQYVARPARMGLGVDPTKIGAPART